MNNVRHGNGKFMNSEYVYLGQWHSDMKHGQGKLMRSNQEPIYGSFANDKLNGLATQGEEIMLFKDGMRIELGKEEGPKTKILKLTEGSCWFIGIFGGIHFVSTTEIEFIQEFSAHLFGLILCFYLAYLIKSCNDEVSKFMDNVLSISDLFKDIEKAINAAPECDFYIYCYDKYEGKDNEHVNVSRERKKFKIDQWVDRSPPASNIDFLKFFKLTRLEIDESVEMSPIVRKRYEDEKAAFIKENNKDN